MTTSAAPPLDSRLLMVGCGSMGGAMLRRWLDAGVSPSQVTVVSPSGRAMPPGVTVVRSIPDAHAFDTILLALKPQQIAALRDTPLADAAPSLLVSILAGVEHDVLASLSAARGIVRAMPNLPVALGKGVVALRAGPGSDDGLRARVTRLMAPLGLVEWFDGDRSFAAATLLAGCGPAFLFRFTDALAQAGIGIGLEPAAAARLALATVEGAALMAAADERSPAALADAVASPGGITRAGLDVLDHDGALDRLLQQVFAAGVARSAALAAEARGSGAA